MRAAFYWRNAVRGRSWRPVLTVLLIGGLLPVLGLQRERGAVEPPTTSGRPITGNNQITADRRAAPRPVERRMAGPEREIGRAGHIEGVVPVAAVPVPALGIGFLVLLAAGNLLAAGPAIIAARIRPAVALRAE